MRTADLLRFATAGSVDDGKSTLIGRLLFDSKAIFADQLEQMEEASRRRGGNGTVDLSLLTDGLRAEREQGITIDVAYRYFATPRRKFIIADTPGHEQYTRNMVTGASTANLSIVLVDARNGVVEQSRRHATISSLLGIPHIVLAVNKMDLVDWDEAVFDRIVADFDDFVAPLDVKDVTAIPLSALEGDNVVDRSDNMPWYQGPPLLYHLEHVHIAADRNLADPRVPVQWVIRPQEGDYRAYAGQVAGGVLRAGDRVIVLPGGQETTIAGIDVGAEEVEEAFPTMSVAIRLSDDVDVSRGDMIVGAEDAPAISRDIDATICWMADAPLRERGRYIIKHTTRSTRAVIDRIDHKLDINTQRHDETATELGLNDIGRVHLRTGEPLVVDRYTRNRTTGSFIVIDETTNDTVGAGMILSAKR
jgi:sulfate adenylyltransferase large subunit